MGNRVTFELGADLDASVTNAAKRFHDAMKATRDLFPGMNTQAKIAGDTMRLTLTEAGKAAEKTGQHISLMSKRTRSSNLLMFEGVRVAQDFAQVIGQQGVAGAVRASANNIQRMVEIIAYAVPGFATWKLVAAGLATATLPILGDAFFGVGDKAKQAKVEVDDLIKSLKEHVDLVEKLRQERRAGEIGSAQAAFEQKRLETGRIIREAESKAIAAEDKARAAEDMAAASTKRATTGPGGFINRILLGEGVLPPGAREDQSAAAAARQTAKVLRRRADEVRREATGALAAEEAELRKKEAADVQAKRDAFRDALRRGAEVRGQIVSEAVEVATAPFGARRRDIAERQARLGIEREAFEAAGRADQGRGRRVSPARRAEQARLQEREDILSGENRKLQVEIADATKQGAANGLVQVQMMSMAVQYALRMPIVPIPFINR